MKIFINGKMYNTETARFVGDAFIKKNEPPELMELRLKCQLSSSKKLYQKSTGEYFLHIEEEYIHPLTLDNAKNWAKEYFSVDDYIKAFGEPEE